MTSTLYISCIPITHLTVHYQTPFKPSSSSHQEAWFPVRAPLTKSGLLPTPKINHQLLPLNCLPFVSVVNPPPLTVTSSHKPSVYHSFSILSLNAHIHIPKLDHIVSACSLHSPGFLPLFYRNCFHSLISFCLLCVL